MSGSLAGVILAAGRSTRFGAADKLQENLGGSPLSAHAAAAMRTLAPDHLAVVCPAILAPVFGGFTRLCAPAGSGQAASLAAAVRFARDNGAARLLVTLADMPFVTAEELAQVVARAGSGAAAASDGVRPMPPALFPAADFPALAALTGDEGARSLLRALPPERLVLLPPRHLMDIDTADDLAAAEAVLRMD